MYTLSDPTFAVENLIGVMMKVTEGSAERVCEELIVSEALEDIKSKCSTERELIHSCTDIYVKCDPYSNWEEVASRLYKMEETAAVEEVRSYLNPRGRFVQWVWFVVNYRACTFQLPKQLLSCAYFLFMCTQLSQT